MDEINYFSEPNLGSSQEGRTLPEFCYSPNATLNVLFFVSYNDMQHKIVQSMNYYPEGLQRPHHNFKVQVWGPGFEDYDGDFLLAQNIQRQFGRKDFFHIVYIPYTSDRTVHDVISIKDNSYVVRCAAELRRTQETITKSRGHVLIGVYAQEVPIWAERLLTKGISLVGLPWLFNKDKINGDVEGYRPIDVAFMASKGGQYYPYREVLYEASEILRERGYNVVNSQISKGGKENWELTSNGSEIYAEYLKTIRSTKIFLTTSSACGYMVGKYGEAMASGAMLFGTVPDEMPKIWEHVMGVIPKGLRAEEIADEIEKYLRDGERRRHIAKNGQEFAHTILEVDVLGKLLRKLYVDWKCWNVRKTIFVPYDFYYLKEMYFPGSSSYIHLGDEYNLAFGEANQKYEARCPIEEKGEGEEFR
eukprot:TRINITY_DN482_c0_g1_i1.p1 TRINITY_DN482_c0_g1~~TRINITY_DN482_c0_g1_i1.p1  ORF type:complete len:478 (-),score=63.21 TRINITY_DN482_c0_g1_i1:96-1349(-)